MQLWSSGQQDRAVVALLAVQWKTVVFAETSIVRVTEEQFRALSAEEQRSMQQRGMDFVSVMGGIVRHTVALGGAAEGERHFRALLECGEALARGKSLEIVKAAGTSMQRLALTKLVELYRSTNDVANLNVAENRLAGM